MTNAGLDLLDDADAAAQRATLGLGTAATANTGTGATNVILGNDTRLTDGREWTADIVAQAEAEAGTATTARKWTAQRVRQALLAWWNALTNVNTSGDAVTITQSGTGNALRTNGPITVKPNNVSPTYDTEIIPTSAWSKVSWDGESDASTATFSGLTIGALYQIEWTNISGSYTFDAALDGVVIANATSTGTRSVTFTATATSHVVSLTPTVTSTATINTPVFRRVLTRGGALALTALNDTSGVALEMRASLNNNVSLGMNALRNNTTGTQNSAFGRGALEDNTTGHQNSAVGMSALQRNTMGYQNAAVGTNSLINNRAGYQNSAMGMLSLSANTTGYENSALGSNALRANTVGYRNSALGVNAGRYAGTDTTGNSASNTSTYVGWQSRAGASGNTNEVVIGHDVVGAGSNTTTLGNASTTLTRLHSNTLQLTTSRTPASATDVGNAGEICWDATHIYVCVDTNTWRRIAHATW
jgi:hypothetical protein